MLLMLYRLPNPGHLIGKHTGRRQMKWAHRRSCSWQSSWQRKVTELIQTTHLAARCNKHCSTMHQHWAREEVRALQRDALALGNARITHQGRQEPRTLQRDASTLGTERAGSTKEAASVEPSERLLGGVCLRGRVLVREIRFRHFNRRFPADGQT